MTKPLTFLLAILVFISCGESKKEKPAVTEVIKPQYAKGFELHKLADGSTDVLLFDPLNPTDTIGSFNWVKPKEYRIAVDGISPILFLSKIHHVSDMCAAHFPKVRNSIFIQEKIGGMQLVDVAMNDERLDASRVIASKANVVFVIYDENSKDEIPMIEKELVGKDIRLIVIADKLEPHPLGRIEWITLFGMLLDEKDKAGRYLNTAVTEYNALVAEVKEKVKTHPKVMYGDYGPVGWQSGIFNPQLTQYLEDAGAENIMSAIQPSGPFEMPDDSICGLLRDADFIGFNLAVLPEWPARRYISGSGLVQTCESLPGNIFYCDIAKQNLYEDGVMEPQVLLRDFATLFHPQEFAGTPKYFQRNY